MADCPLPPKPAGMHQS